MDIKVSKIVGSPSETAWAQASSTGRLYIVLSLKSASARGLTATGKEALEQLQREFYALDEKKLADIKDVCSRVLSTLDKNLIFSGVVATIINDIFYVVTLGDAKVLIDRNNNLAEVARGEEEQIIGFSGRLKSNDIIVLETNEFNKKISNKLLAEYTSSHNPEKLAEDLAPFILENSNGNEAAVIISFENQSNFTSPPAYDDENNEAEIDEHFYGNERTESEYAESMENIPAESPKKKTAFIANLFNKFSNVSTKQKGIVIFILIIILLLIGSLALERYIDSRRVAGEEFSTIFNEADTKYESAEGLSSLNRGRALEEINSGILTIKNNLSKFPEGTDEYKKLNELLAKLEALKNELGGGSEVAGNVIFTLDDTEILETIEGVSATGDNFVVLGDGGYAVINTEGEVKSEEKADIPDFKRSISDDTYSYLLGSSVTRITISNGNTSEIIDDTSDYNDISYFGTSVYLLNSGGDVKKFSGSSFSESDYFSEKPNMNGDTISIAIDSSVYILTENGEIRKFSRGTADSDFSQDESVKISSNSLLYTREEFDNIYILDKDNSGIVQMGNDGSIKKKFNALNLANAKSFTVSSDESKIMAVIGNEVYSYDL